MDNNREYEKFIKYLLKEYFTFDEINKLLDNDFVDKVTEEAPDNRHKNCIKYCIELVDGNIYYAYVKKAS